MLIILSPVMDDQKDKTIRVENGNGKKMNRLNSKGE